MRKTMVPLVMLILIVFMATASAETPVRLMYDSLLDLLFETGNVTLTGHAEFSLDGDRFKTADTSYVQDGTSSLWQWKLLTPRWDGSLRESGFTIIANGEKVYVMEAFYPGVYRTALMNESGTILRRSVQLNLLRDLLRILADQSEDLLGEAAIRSVADDTGLTVQIQAGKDVPEIINTALNMTVQLVAKRYFDTNYDQISEPFMFPMDNYITVTQAILGSTYYMSLNQADVTLKRDAAGHFESAEGNISLCLATENDGTRTMDIAFRLDASSWGESKVDTFNPEDYSVTLADDAMSFDLLPET